MAGITGLSKLGNIPYQGPMPFQQMAGSIPGANSGGIPGIGNTSLLSGTSGLDSFGSNFGGMSSMNMGGMGNMSAMPGMSSMGNMGGMGNLGIAGSTLQLMSQISTMMASVMQGLMSFVQTLLASKQQQGEQGTNPGGDMLQASAPGTSGTQPGNDSGTPGSSNNYSPTSSTTPTKTDGSGKTSQVKAGKGSTEKMKKLAAAAEKSARSKNTHGWCLKGVQDAMDAAGMSMPRRKHAYQMANDLASSGKFKEVPAGDLKSLPAGSIVVWSNDAKRKSGHISVALGNGQEASDHVGPQITSMTKAKVFVPV